MADHHLKRKDEEATNSLLRDFIGLPAKGSYIVLADRLDSFNLRNIPTSSATIGQQLELITRYCNSQEERLPSDFNRLVSELNGREIKSRKSFIDILIDYSSLISPLNFFGKFFGKREQVQNATRVLNHKLKELETLEEEAYFEESSNLAIVAGVAIKNSSFIEGLLPKNRARAFESKINRHYHLLSDYSQTLYQTFLFLESTMRDHPIDDLRLDYSFLTINLGKIIEYELNLSILQMIRAVMQIEMPSYYNNYSLRHGDVEIPTGITTVNVNQPMERENKDRDHSPLKGVPIGNLMYAYEILANNHSAISPTPDISRLIRLNEIAIRFFKRFSSQYRNRAGHIDLNSEDTYLEAKKAFQEFLDEHLPFLYDIRLFLSSPSYLTPPTPSIL